MNEDYGNLDQLNFFAAYCFNAGHGGFHAPLGHQTNEVIPDNDDAAVTWSGAWSESTSNFVWGTAGDVPYRQPHRSPRRKPPHGHLHADDSRWQATIRFIADAPRVGSGDQLYRIRHTGGEALVRIPHHHGRERLDLSGRILFQYGANPAVGSVVISNCVARPRAR